MIFIILQVHILRKYTLIVSMLSFYLKPFLSWVQLLGYNKTTMKCNSFQWNLLRCRFKVQNIELLVCTMVGRLVFIYCSYGGGAFCGSGGSGFVGPLAPGTSSGRWCELCKVLIGVWQNVGLVYCFIDSLKSFFTILDEFLSFFQILPTTPPLCDDRPSPLHQLVLDVGDSSQRCQRLRLGAWRRLGARRGDGARCGLRRGVARQRLGACGAAEAPPTPQPTAPVHAQSLSGWPGGGAVSGNKKNKK